jgi:uncharacterized paraquat-inducible protein A
MSSSVAANESDALRWGTRRSIQVQAACSQFIEQPTCRLSMSRSPRTVPTLHRPGCGEPVMKCSRCHRDNPAHAKFCLACATPLKLAKKADLREASAVPL